METHDVELLSSEGNEIMGAAPRWIILWGNLLIFATIVSLILLSFLVKYPNTIEGSTVLAPTQAPAVVRAQTPGAGRLLVANGATVRAGQAIMTQPAAAGAAPVTYRAPAAGRLLLLRDITRASARHDSLFAVVPAANTYRCVAFVPTDRYPKIVPGQRVLVALKDYPSAEYGKLIGQVAEVAVAPQHNTFRVVVAVPDLRATNSKLLPLVAQAQGSAEIFIQETSLFDRIFEGTILNL